MSASAQILFCRNPQLKLQLTLMLLPVPGKESWSWICLGCGRQSSTSLFGFHRCIFKHCSGDTDAGVNREAAMPNEGDRTGAGGQQKFGWGPQSCCCITKFRYTNDQKPHPPVNGSRHLLTPRGRHPRTAEYQDAH